MPRAVSIATLVTIWAASFAFAAGILSSSAALSIKPLLKTPVCMSPSIWRQMNNGNGMASVNTSNYYSTGTPDAISNGEMWGIPPSETPLPAPVSNATELNSTMSQLAEIMLTPPPTLSVALIDVTAIANKLGVCKGWNMCHGSGIKMLSCKRLKGFNEWNAFFFFFSAFTLPPLYLW
eukprot:CAMPEP_0179446800 /NCGR_PEP_ID=MMETSP0799-20121207/30355_1 /TAXON_ID=46947 /ORGANISM="Geminigera cryophila, Strain CCMP2564" /LENGTH=177 /DNA_ID=CAMNT_0021236423 /DNA_START=17 /DNA_END=547 /DNA_ORIENTATION=-